MTCMTFKNATTLLFLLAGLQLGNSLSSHNKTFKLEIHLDERASSPTEPRGCEFLSLAETQAHKGLRHSTIVEDNALPVVYGGEVSGSSTDSQKFKRFYSNDVDQLWERAESVCGPSSGWDFDSIISPNLKHWQLKKTLQRPDNLDWTQYPVDESESRDVLSTGSLKGKVPSLEVIPLFITGPSSNRVDITFFGDGCAYYLPRALGRQGNFNLVYHRYAEREGEIPFGCSIPRVGYFY